MEEFEAVRDAVARGIGNGLFSARSDLWLGGTYNSAEQKYQWIGSGVNADQRKMFIHYPPRPNNNYKIMYSKGAKKILAISKNVSFQPSICEEYPVN